MNQIERTLCNQSLYWKLDKYLSLPYGIHTSSSCSRSPPCIYSQAYSNTVLDSRCMVPQIACWTMPIISGRSSLSNLDVDWAAIYTVPSEMLVCLRHSSRCIGTIDQAARRRCSTLHSNDSLCYRWWSTFCMSYGHCEVKLIGRSYPAHTESWVSLCWSVATFSGQSLMHSKRVSSCGTLIHPTTHKRERLHFPHCLDSQRSHSYSNEHDRLLYSSHIHLFSLSFELPFHINYLVHPNLIGELFVQRLLNLNLPQANHLFQMAEFLTHGLFTFP